MGQNLIADINTRLATEGSNSRQQQISYNDISCHTSKAVQEKWHHDWNHNAENKLRQIKQTITD